MPRYEYEDPQTGHRLEVFATMSEAPPLGDVKMLGSPARPYIRVPSRITGSVQKDLQLVSHSQPRGKPGARIFPDRVTSPRFGPDGKPCFQSRKHVHEYCARSSDNDSVEVSYGEV